MYEHWEGQAEFESMFPVPEDVFFNELEHEYDSSSSTSYNEALIYEGKRIAWLLLTKEPESKAKFSGGVKGFAFTLNELTRIIEGTLSQLAASLNKDPDDLCDADLHDGKLEVVIQPMADELITEFARYVAYVKILPMQGMWPVLTTLDDNQQ